MLGPPSRYFQLFQTEHGLLGLSYDWQGGSHRATPAELSLKHRHLPRDQLPRLLGAVLQGAGPSSSFAATAEGYGAGSGRHGATLSSSRGAGARVTSILTAVNPPNPHAVRTNQPADSLLS